MKWLSEYVRLGKNDENIPLILPVGLISLMLRSSKNPKCCSSLKSSEVGTTMSLSSGNLLKSTRLMDSMSDLDWADKDDFQLAKSLLSTRQTLTAAEAVGKSTKQSSRLLLETKSIRIGCSDAAFDRSTCAERRVSAANLGKFPRTKNPQKTISTNRKRK